MRDLADAVNWVHDSLGTGELWWRGEGDSSWPKLLPRIYRGRSREDEKTTIKSFRRQAPARSPELRGELDFSEWLFLMQHHGLATRLLDWTKSPLIATFFAVRDAKAVGKQGRLWVLDPRQLNGVELDCPRLILQKDPSIAAIFVSAFSDDVNIAAQKNGTQTAGICPAETNLRMMNQQSMFTVHGSDKALNEHPEASRFLRDFNIPSDAKGPFLEELRRNGIGLSTLFPDLDHLAEELNSYVFTP